MLRLFPRLMLVAGIGMTGAACQDDGVRRTRAATISRHRRAPAIAATIPHLLHGMAIRSLRRATTIGNQAGYNQTDGRRYTTVTVTNRGQNGYRDDVVQQQVVCGSQYYDGYRTRTAPRC